MAQHTPAMPRVWGVDYRWRTVVPTAVLAIFVALIPARTWPAYVGAVLGASAVVAVGVITLGGHTGPQWIASRIATWWRGRGHDPVDAPADEDGHRPEVVSVLAGGEEVGVRWHGGQLVCVLDLHGHPQVLHLLSQRRVFSDAKIPVDELETALANLGPAAPATVDVVFPSARLARTSYTSIYDTHLSGRPVIGSRRTLLIARFDPERAPAYYAARESLPDAAAHIMARLRRSLAAADCPSTALTGTQLCAFLDDSAPADQERWGYLAPVGEQLVDTVYSVDPQAFNDNRWPDLWSIRADEVVPVFRRDRKGRWSGFVRVRTSRPLPAPPLPFLRLLPGQQGAAVAIGRPVAATAPPITVFEPVPSLAGLTLPTGSDGASLGLTEAGDEQLLPLVPGAGRIVSARVDDVYAEQLLLRAAACGAHITLITDRPRRWAEVAGSRISIVAPDAARPAGAAQLHVYDQRTPADANDHPPKPPAEALAASLGLIELGGEEPEGHITLDQIGEMVAVTVAGETTWIKAVVDASEVPLLPSARARVAAASGARS
ncbi:type VII secretion protein EccE [Mycobacteroides abscessus subsp. massiliense]|uniref:type VII secretion protein EccE n=1 Tax=Mycobacteroides abscessus TaxID=36809 RepID=UPI0009D4F410|nr:type VII secretion protein EccE [Mycobacteroides abscessus]SLE83830.1 type VII secretion protein EccE [Mycobacteroides abscessus subsp. massiliense]